MTSGSGSGGGCSRGKPGARGGFGGGADGGGLPSAARRASSAAITSGSKLRPPPPRPKNRSAEPMIAPTHPGGAMKSTAYRRRLRRMLAM